MEPTRIIVRPHVTEKAITLAERQNVLTFIVDIKATKLQVRGAVERLYNVKVKKVSTLIAPTGEKKAYVKLAEGYNAVDVLSRMGML